MPSKRRKTSKPAPRRRTVAQAKRRSTKRRSTKRRRARKNPVPGSRIRADATSFAIDIGVGFAGYAGTRLLSRGVAQAVSKKSPKMAKHAGVIGSAAVFGAAFFALPAWKKTEEYAPMALIGSGIAVLQNVFRTYLPKYGWIVGDYHADIGAEKPAALPEPRGDVEEIPEEWSPEMSLPADMQGSRTVLPGGGEGGDDLSDILDADLGSLGYGGDSADLALAEYGS